MTELKPCPHCGSPMVSAWSGLVQCDECHATIAGDTQEDSVSLWNSRVISPSQAKQVSEEIGRKLGMRDHYELVTLLGITVNALRAAGFEVQS